MMTLFDYLSFFFDKFSAQNSSKKNSSDNFIQSQIILIPIDIVTANQARPLPILMTHHHTFNIIVSYSQS